MVPSGQCLKGLDAAFQGRQLGPLLRCLGRGAQWERLHPMVSKAAISDLNYPQDVK